MLYAVSRSGGTYLKEKELCGWCLVALGASAVSTAALWGKHEPSWKKPSEQDIKTVLRDVNQGRYERSMSGMTAASALLVCAEVYYEHYKGSFGNRLMWSPILVTPPIVVAGIAGIFSRRAAKTALPAASALYVLTGLAGLILHAAVWPANPAVGTTPATTW